MALGDDRGADDPLLAEVNTRRESEGKLAINSTWFWGAGALPEAAAKPYSVVYADDASRADWGRGRARA
jgi:hypothetical protein